MNRRPPRSTRTTLFPYKPLFRSENAHQIARGGGLRQLDHAACLGLEPCLHRATGAAPGFDQGERRRVMLLARLACHLLDQDRSRSEEHTSELQSLMRTSYAVYCLKKKHK